MCLFFVWVSVVDRCTVILISAGVKADECVGIVMERCIEYAISYIAIHKAGELVSEGVSK